ncbi:MAG: ATP-binding protein [Spirochaetota bacterium]
MIQHIEFRKKPYRRLKINIKPIAEFNEILHILNCINFPGLTVNTEHVIYAILELINNSLRAHREKKVERSIKVVLQNSEGRLQILIQDWGGGFDPSKLPYDLNCNPEEIDMNSPVFQAYREKHGYKRFGIGIYVVKKTFTSFRLYFINGAMQEVEWGNGRIAGTCIELTLGD